MTHFLHTADWQIGRQYGQFETDDAAMLAEARFEAVARIARDLAAGEHIALVETFAERVALACLEDHRVLAVKVRVEKPGAIPGAAAAGCEVAYSR